MSCIGDVCLACRGGERKKEMGNEREVFFLFFYPPSPLIIRSVRLVERVDGREGGRRDCENPEETIKEKCKHGGQNADKRHKTLHLPVLNSPCSFFSVDASLESSDCGRLLSNQNPYETVSERRRESTMHDKSGPANRCNQSGCLCLTVSIEIHQRFKVRRPTRNYLHTVFLWRSPFITACCSFIIVNNSMKWLKPAPNSLVLTVNPKTV